MENVLQSCIFCFLLIFNVVTCDFTHDATNKCWPGYDQIINKTYFPFCAPDPCLEHDMPLVTVGIARLIITLSNKTLESICRGTQELTKSVEPPTCRYKHLTTDKFRLNKDDQSLYEYSTNKRYRLGQYIYFYSTGEAWICQDTVPAPEQPPILFFCPVYEPEPREYRFFPYNRRANVSRIFRKGLYFDGEVLMDEVCFYMGPIPINLRWFSQPVFKLEPSLEYRTAPFSTYRRDETRAVYGVACAVSAFFTLVTILAQFLFVKLNYHAKVQFCHNISLFIMYLVMSIRHLYLDYSRREAKMCFMFQYISVLSAFFWLNVLAYELWKVFAQVNGSLRINSSSFQKLWFIVKCFYAWGTPFILCIFSIILAYRPASAKLLGLSLKGSGFTWFQTNASFFIWYYGPIILLLVINTIFFTLSTFIKKSSRGSKLITNREFCKRQFYTFTKICTVMSLIWITEVTTAAYAIVIDDITLHIVDLVTGLEGVVIYFVYDYENSTWKMLKKCWKCDILSNNTKKITSINSKKSTTSSDASF